MGPEWILVTVLLGSDPVQVINRSFGEDSPECRRIAKSIDGHTLITQDGKLYQIKAGCVPSKKVCTLLDFCE